MHLSGRDSWKGSDRENSVAISRPRPNSGIIAAEAAATTVPLFGVGLRHPE